MFLNLKAPARVVFKIYCSFRPVVLSVEQRHQRELDEKEQELAAKVARATCEQLTQKVQQDMTTLQARLPTKEKEAAESLLDQKYLRDRQKSFGTVFKHFMN